jgi:hypothetical protein
MLQCSVFSGMYFALFLLRGYILRIYEIYKRIKGRRKGGVNEKKGKGEKISQGKNKSAMRRMYGKLPWFRQ